MTAFPHYFKRLPPGCTHVDVYRVLELFGVTDAPLQHAIKKLLCAGSRGAKDQDQDIAEAIATLQRWQQMREEEQPAPDLREAVAEMREIRGQYCLCGDRAAIACPGQWEPGCDLGAKEAHAVPAPPEAALALREAMQAAAAPEDAERAAYLERWANAPEWANWCSEDASGRCDWLTDRPRLNSLGFWEGGLHCYAGQNLLGSVRCEPRPQPVEDPERAAYLARWANAPEWGQWLSQDHDGECGWSTEQPSRYEGRWLCTVPDKESFGESLAPPNLLGSFGCEPRPTPAGGQGVQP